MARYPYKGKAWDIYERQSGPATIGSVSGPQIVGSAAAGPTMADSLNRTLAHAGLQLNEAMGKAWAQYRDNQADEILLANEMEFEKWKHDYIENNRGANGGNAFADFVNKWSEMADSALKDSGISENEAAHYKLRRQLLTSGIHAAHQGHVYAEEQNALWRKSHWESAKELAFSRIAQSAGDAELCEFEIENIASLYDQYHPGEDNSAAIAAIRAEADNRRFQALIEAGDLEGAEGVLRKSIERENSRLNDANGGFRGQQGLGAGHGAGYSPGQDGLGKPARIAENAELINKSAGYVNVHRNNPGNVKVSANEYAVYDTWEDGLLAVFDRFNRYHSKAGWDSIGGRKAESLRDIITIYAPPGENKTDKYVKDAAKATGLDPDAKLDFSNSEQMAKLASYVLYKENSVKTGWKTLADIYESYKKGARPKVVGKTPARKAERNAHLASTPSFKERRTQRLEVHSLDDGEPILTRTPSGNRLRPEDTSFIDSFQGQNLTPSQRRMVQTIQIAKNARNAEKRMQEEQAIIDEFSKIKPEEREDFIRKAPEHLRAALIRYGNQMIKEEQRAFTEQFNGSLDDMIKAGMEKGLSENQIRAQGLHMLDALKGEQRAKAEKYFNERVKSAFERQSVERLAALDDFLDANPGHPQDVLDAARIKFATNKPMLELVEEHFLGGRAKENASNKAALAAGYRLKDSGGLRDDRELLEYGMRHNLTYEQRKALKDYGGKSENVTYSQVLDAINLILPEDERKKSITPDEYTAILNLLPPGKAKYTQQEIAGKAAIFYMKGGDKPGWFTGDAPGPMEYANKNGMSLDGWEAQFTDEQKERLAPRLAAFGLDIYEERDLADVRRIVSTVIAAQSGGRIHYTPEPSETERQQIEGILKARGIEVTESNIRKVLTNNILQQFGGGIVY